MTKNGKKFACLTTVRTSSSRLPGKALMAIRGKRVIEHVIERAKSVKGADVVIVCTSTEPEDDILVDIAKQHGVECFRGSVLDRLGRMLGAAEKYGVDYITTFDGDDLFCDPELTEMAIEQMSANPCDLLKGPDGLICGSFTFCISVEAMKKAYQLRKNDNTEMYEVYFLENGQFNIRDLKVNDKIFFNDRIRLTLDYQEDLDFFKRVFDELKIDTNTIPLRAILKLLQEKSEIAEINFSRQKDYVEKRERMRSKITS